MNHNKLCKDTLIALCKTDDIYTLSDIPVSLKKHIEVCRQCSSFYESLLRTIDLYRKYDIKLDKDVQKKLLCTTCEKLRNES
jgi:uncharacterized protein YaaW (UPF0174 family)